MNRNQKRIYCFIYDENKHFYRASQSHDGSWVIKHNAEIKPLRHNPKNLLESPVEFATNKRYFSMNRSINYPLEFTFDGAAILNSKYIIGKGVNENLYFAIFEFDSEDGIYKLSYNGKFDFQSKKRDERLATFTVSVIDDSAWGVLSQNDDVEYAIDCSENNPNAIKVLFDNFTLENRYTFQTVQAPIVQLTGNNTHAIPFVLVMEDGDSSGLIVKSQTSDETSNYITYVRDSSNYFLSTFYQINNVRIRGQFWFNWSTLTLPSGGLLIYFLSSTGQRLDVFYHPTSGLIPGFTYKFDFDFTVNLAPGEKFFFLADLNDNAARHFTITPIVTSVFISTVTKAEPTICYGLRPLHLLKEIVKKATIERYSIESTFFEVNNKTILLPGDSIRGIKDSKIYTSFRSFFETFSALFFMALRVVNGSLFMELADEVYKKGDENFIDIGEIIEMETSPASDYMGNEVVVGSPRKDYRHQSGRLEFNSENSFSLQFSNVKGKISWVTKYRTDGYGAIFLMLDYRGLSTRDNSGDKEVFVVDITDEIATATANVETFENFTVNNAPLAPIIKSPLDGDIVHFNKPTLKGVGIPGTNVNIYIFDVLDGGTTVDANGNWIYEIDTALPSYEAGVSDGISVINATNTNMLAAVYTIQLIIDTTVSSPFGITYPRAGDYLYNNKPMLRGVADAGTNVNISIDGVFIGTAITDNSCKWDFKITTPLSNGNHIIDIGGGVSISINVNSSVKYPLITYIGSELDGFPITNNKPLIEGVATPGTLVTLWLNYVSYSNIGTVISDANGNWSFQTVDTSYVDGGGITVTMVPIRNGLNVVSTSLINNTVYVNVTGYKLNRPAYDSITGVPDNTVINTRLSPKRMLLNHKSMLSAIMNKQRNATIRFETADKNANLRTVLGSEVISERADVQANSLGAPIAILEEAHLKVIAKHTFAKTLYNFNNGGTVRGVFKGKYVYFLPIGSMKLKSIVDDIQEWKLLISPLTSYSTLLNLYKNGLTVNLMENSIYHDDSNSLHMVEYDFTQPGQYNFKSIYEDWFMNRNAEYLLNPTYIQKFQTTEIITDQIITNGISSMTLKMYRCRDAMLIDTFNYDPVAPSPIPLPEIVLEAHINLGNYPPEQYFFVAYVGDTIVYISERIETRIKWHNTLLLNSYNDTNRPGAFYSTGFRTIIRVEGLVKKIQPVIDAVVAKEESGDTKTVYSNISKKRGVRFGTAYGIPDYIAIKIANAISNNNCSIEGVKYTLEEGEKMQPSENVNGHPMNYYDVTLTLQDNSRGKVFPGVPGADVTGVVVVVDASAIGLPAHSLINISED